ncbi:MAG: 3-deoxy-7-phosphoheptulonate synthase [Sphingomonas sp.]
MIQGYSQIGGDAQPAAGVRAGRLRNLHQVHRWTHDFMGRSPWSKKYADVADRIGESLDFMAACGIDADSVPQLKATQFYNQPRGAAASL